MIHLFDYLPAVYFFAKDSRHRYIGINRTTLTQVFGLEHEDEILGRTDSEFQPPALAAGRESSARQPERVRVAGTPGQPDNLAKNSRKLVAGRRAGLCLLTESESDFLFNFRTRCCERSQNSACCTESTMRKRPSAKNAKDRQKHPEPTPNATFSVRISSKLVRKEKGQHWLLIDR